MYVHDRLELLYKDFEILFLISVNICNLNLLFLINEMLKFFLNFSNNELLPLIELMRLNCVEIIGVVVKTYIGSIFNRF